MLTVSIGEQIEAARALIARLSVEDTGEEERAALLALRDAVLTRAPLANVRPLTNQERLANNARARFDAAFPPPTDGPVASAVDRAAHRRLNAEERTARAGRLGRYYVEGYEIEGGAIRWRVQDRYIDGAAFFALDDPTKPARLEGYADSAEALKRIYWLDAYFHDRGCTIGPRATTVPITELISEIVCAYVPPALPPLLPTPKRSRSPNPDAPAVVRTPGRLAVARILPDEVWFRVGSLIPPEPADKQTKKPRVTSDRTALAGILTYLRSDAGWHSIPRTIGCSPMLCRKRLKEWQHAGAWVKIEDALYDMLPDKEKIHWDKAYGEPFATLKARLGIVRRAERYRSEQGLSLCEMGHAIFGHGTTYKRTLEQRNMLERTRQIIASWINETSKKCV